MPWKKLFASYTIDRKPRRKPLRLANENLDFLSLSPLFPSFKRKRELHVCFSSTATSLVTALRDQSNGKKYIIRVGVVPSKFFSDPVPGTEATEKYRTRVQAWFWKESSGGMKNFRTTTSNKQDTKG